MKERGAISFLEKRAIEVAFHDRVDDLTSPFAIDDDLAHVRPNDQPLEQ